MKPQAYQKPTIYNSDGTKAQIGTYDIRTDPLTNSTADGILDYINNNLEALTDAANTYLDKLSKTEQVVTAPIKGTLNGNASSATKLATARTINVTDADGTNTGTGASFNGSGNATIKLPAKIKATLTGNADTATKATNDGNGNNIARTYLPLSGGTLTGVVNGVTPTAGDNSKKLATTEFVTATAQQADWNVTDTTSKAFVKNKPINLVNIGNSPTFNLINLSKVDNAGYPVYFLMHELVQYNPDKLTLPISAVYGFNGMVFGQPRVGNSDSQFLAIVTVGLGFEYNELYSSSGHYSPVVIKDETNNKYYWAMKIEGSYQNVYMLGVFTANPLKTAILAVDVAGTLPEGWSLVHTAKLYPFDDTHVASADKDGQGNTIASTYLPAVVGAVVAFAGSTTPNGWLLCDGSAVSRTDYAALFAVIGTTYGAGNGSTTFNLPNLVDKFVEGSATAGTVKSAGLPNITGDFSGAYYTQSQSGVNNVQNGAFVASTGGVFLEENGERYVPTDWDASKAGLRRRNVNLNASRSSAIYGNSTTVQPPALTMRYIIKY